MSGNNSDYKDLKDAQREVGIEMKKKGVSSHYASTYKEIAVSADGKFLDNTDEEVTAVCFEDEASWLSYIFLSFMDGIFIKGMSEPIEHEDLGVASKADRCASLSTRFEEAWEAQKKRPLEKRSLWTALFQATGYSLIGKAMVYQIVYAAFSFGPILIMTQLVEYFDDEIDLTTAQLWTYVCLLFFFPVIGSIFQAHSNVCLAHAGLQYRNCLITKIYRKSIVLSTSARAEASSGKIVTMFSNDTQQVQRFIFFSNICLTAPVTIGVCLWLIYNQIGWASFVGLGFMMLIMPLNGLIFNFLASFRKEKNLLTDQRVKLMNEILNGIRIIKFYGWEGSFSEKIFEAREKELLVLKKIAYLVAVAFSLVLMAVPILMPIIIFYTYIADGNELTAAKAFTVIALFNLMQFSFIFLPMGLNQYSQVSVANERMVNFFDLPELENYKEEVPLYKNDCAISISRASFGWVLSDNLNVATSSRESMEEEGASELNMIEVVIESVSNENKKDDIALKADSSDIEDSPNNFYDGTTHLVNRSIQTLMDINVDIKKGQLVAVIGPVGCGKSSFLAALLGEMHKKSGSIAINGTIAYCEQKPWILNDTVYNNIIFRNEYDEEKFDQALYAGNLEDDVNTLPGGIQTQIGEKGINLSGGQKARVALARAIYDDADIYLLDDPLSAVDAHVGQFLFHECIQTVLAGKTRILVTHQVHHLPYVDKVIVIQNGRLTAEGTYDELMQRGIDFNALIEPTEEVEETVIQPVLAKSATTDFNKSDLDWWETNRKLFKSKSETSARLRKLDSRSSKIITKEQKNEGNINWEAYVYYVKAGGIGLALCLLMFMILSQLFLLLSIFWLQYWGEESLKASEENDPLTTSENTRYLQIYALFSCLSLVCYVGRSITMANHRLGTSSHLHSGLLSGVLGSPVAFFDVTPVGRILNRFSADLQVIDEELTQTLSQLSNSLMSVLGALCGIVGATKGTFLVLAIPLVWLYNFVQKNYRLTNTAISRLESVSKSPIYTDFSQVLQGISSIRAYKSEDMFTERLENAVDNNAVASITMQLSGFWLAIRLDLIGGLVSFFIALVAVLFPGFLSAGFLAVGLTFSFQLTTSLKFLVRMLAAAEAQMSAVERIREFMSGIVQEESGDEVSPNQIPKDWPAEGQIIFDHVDMRYRDGPLVLKDLSFNIAPAEKVGIAGRTGSGKSSIMAALFRIQEITMGKISIDGLDIDTVPLQILRTKLGIIPQDPVLFSFTVRFNLDPLGKHTDDELWDVLDRLRMKDYILSLPKNLDENVAEGGENFSAGQRQLVCIGRAILRNPKILVLDEATASIDNETDALVQNLIKDQFSSSTILTIAHRLNTIIDSDKIIILQDGELMEADKPQELLKKSDGKFKELWEKHLASHKSTSSNSLDKMG